VRRFRHGHTANITPGSAVVNYPERADFLRHWKRVIAIPHSRYRSTRPSLTSAQNSLFGDAEPLDFVYRGRDFRISFHGRPRGRLMNLPVSNIWCSLFMPDLPMLSVMVHVKCHG